MKEIIKKKIYISPKEIMKKFGVKGTLVSFDMPTRGVFSKDGTHGKHLLIIVEDGDVDED